MSSGEPGDALDRLVGWLNRRLAPPGVRIEPDTPLFAERLIDSIRVLELIAWTEDAFALRIPDRMIRLDHFRDARTIVATFGRGSVDVER